MRPSGPARWLSDALYEKVRAGRQSIVASTSHVLESLTG